MTYGKYIEENLKYYPNYLDKIDNLEIFENREIDKDENLIYRFKELLEPYNKSNSGEDSEFMLICFYLHTKGYYIKEFPLFLELPTSREDLSYNKIRSRIMQQRNKEGIVRWQERREFISKMTVLKNANNIIVSEDIKRILNNVLLNEGEFEKKTNDEKLLALTNIIEYLLKDGEKSKYREIQTNDTFNLISNESIVNYRKQLNIFRHHNKECVEKRKEMTNKQKQFLINYGLTIVCYIYEEDNK